MPLAGHQDELGVEEAQNYCSLIVMNDDDEWLGKVELLQLQETQTWRTARRAENRALPFNLYKN